MADERDILAAADRNFRAIVRESARSQVGLTETEGWRRLDDTARSSLRLQPDARGDGPGRGRGPVKQVVMVALTLLGGVAIGLAAPTLLASAPPALDEGAWAPLPTSPSLAPGFLSPLPAVPTATPIGVAAPASPTPSPASPTPRPMPPDALATTASRPSATVGMLPTPVATTRREVATPTPPAPALAEQMGATPPPATAVLSATFSSVAPSPASLPVAYVGNTGGAGTYLRRSALHSDHWLLLPEGTPLVLLGSQAERDDDQWLWVRDPHGHVGWVQLQAVVPQPPSGPAQPSHD